MLTLFLLWMHFPVPFQQFGAATWKSVRPSTCNSWREEYSQTEVMWSALTYIQKIRYAQLRRLLKSTIGKQWMMCFLTDKYIFKGICGNMKACISHFKIYFLTNMVGTRMLLPSGWAYKSPSSLPQPSHYARNQRSSWRFYVYYKHKAASN